MTKNQIITHITVSTLFPENTYISHLEGSLDCLVVDPGLNPELILEVLDEHKLRPVAILNTHGHIDHIAGNSTLKEAYPDCPLVIGTGDAYKLTDPVANLSAGYNVRVISPEADLLVKEGEKHSWAGINFDVLEAPGHSAGHVVYFTDTHSPPMVFGGDVLMQGGVGRADFPDGDEEALLHSIQEKLFSLPDETIVLPGHGPPTTIGDEKRFNPFVGRPAGYKD